MRAPTPQAASSWTWEYSGEEDGYLKLPAKSLMVHGVDGQTAEDQHCDEGY
jgi:hypothetical protein